MQTLEEAQETNRRLNRRLQEMERTYVSRAVKAENRAERWESQWSYMHDLIERREQTIACLWVWIIALAVVLTISILYR